MNFFKIPLNDNEKTPMVSGWSGATQQKLNALNVLAETTTNHGILCGEPNNIIVFDYDTHKLPVDHIHLDSLKHVHGENTLIVQTTSGGYHVYHQFDERVKDWKGVCGLDGYLDIRTTGNYVVGPGSIVNEKEYKVLHKGETLDPVPQGFYELINNQINKPTSNVGNDFDKQEINGYLEHEGFTGIVWKNNYDFDCDQRGKGTECPLCGEEHKSNHYFVFENDVGYFVKNHSKKCRVRKMKPKCMFTEEEKEQIEEHNLEETYMVMKRKFEKDVAFIEDMVCYVVGQNVLAPKKLRDRFPDLWYETSDQKQKKFIETWISDPSKRRYKTLDFIPEGCPKTTYNLWKGFEVEKVEKSSGDIEPFMMLVNQLTENNSDYFMKWLAQLFQRPGSKPITSPVLTSVQGTGKNSLFDFIGNMMGNDLYVETADAENNLFGRFSSMLERCKLLFIDEMEGSAGFKNSSKLKALITNQRHMVEKKGIETYEVHNYAGIVFATNNPTPVRVEGSDRRFFVFNPQKHLDQSFFDNWQVWSKKPENQRAVYEHLMNVDISDVNWIGDRPVNQSYLEMRYNSQPSFIKWLDFMIVEDFKNCWTNKPISINTLFEEYKTFGHTIEKTNVTFAKELNRLVNKDGLRGIIKAPQVSGRKYYRINRQEVFGWLKEKNYTLAKELEPEIRIEINDGDY